MDSVLKDWQISEGRSGARPARALEQGNLANALGFLRQTTMAAQTTASPQYPANVAQSKAPAAAPPMGPLMVQLAESEDAPDKIPYRDVLDQSMGHGTFRILSPERLVAIRANYRKVTGGALPADASPTDEQLLALHAWMGFRGNSNSRAPFVDFCVWS